MGLELVIWRGGEEDLALPLERRLRCSSFTLVPPFSLLISRRSEGDRERGGRGEDLVMKERYREAKRPRGGNGGCHFKKGARCTVGRNYKDALNCAAICRIYPHSTTVGTCILDHGSDKIISYVASSISATIRSRWWHKA